MQLYDIKTLIVTQLELIKKDEIINVHITTNNLKVI